MYSSSLLSTVQLPLYSTSIPLSSSPAQFTHTLVLASQSPYSLNISATSLLVFKPFHLLSCLVLLGSLELTKVGFLFSILSSFFSFFVTVPLRLSRPVQYTKLATRVNASYRKATVLSVERLYSALLPSDSVFGRSCHRVFVPGG